MRRWTGFCNSCCTVPRLSNKVVTSDCDAQQQALETLLVLRCIAHRSRGAPKPSLFPSLHLRARAGFFHHSGLCRRPKQQ